MKFVTLLFCCLLVSLASSCSTDHAVQTRFKTAALSHGERYEVRKALAPSAAFQAPLRSSYFVFVNGGFNPTTPRASTQPYASQVAFTSPAWRSPAPSSTRPPMSSAGNDRLYGVRTTAYCHDEADHLIYGRKTALGSPLRFGLIRSAAADWSRYPAGTLFRIASEPGVVYQVDDYGSALVGTDTIDLYKPSRGLMNNWGVRHVDIEVIRWGCFNSSINVLRDRTRFPHVRRMFDELNSIVTKPSAQPMDHFKRGSMVL